MREIELRRKDGKPVDPWLQEEVNRYTYPKDSDRPC